MSDKSNDIEHLKSLVSKVCCVRRRTPTRSVVVWEANLGGLDAGMA